MIINVEHLEAIAGKDRLVLQALIAQFLATTGSDMERLEVAIGKKDVESIFHFAHRIRGAAQLMGIPPMADLAATLEQYDHRVIHTTLNLRFQQLKDVFMQVQIALKTKV